MCYDRSRKEDTMKKKLLLCLLLIPALLVVVTGCGNKKEVVEQRNIELTDKDFGYSTVFTFAKEENYTEPEEDHGGRTTEITFKNEDLDVSFEMYYTDMRTTTYKDSQKTRSEQKYYKEYKFGDYEAYAYGNYSSGLYLNILIDTDKEKDMAKVLFVSIDRLDVNEEVVVADVLAGEKLQEFFNSMVVLKAE